MSPYLIGHDEGTAEGGGQEQHFCIDKKLLILYVNKNGRSWTG